MLIVAEIAGRITGEDQLSTSPLDLAKIDHIPIHRLLADATRSVRLCECEGRGGSDLSPDQAHICIDCNFTSCLKCGQKPLHNYGSLDNYSRLHPSNFEKLLKQALPMRIAFEGIQDDILNSLFNSKPAKDIAAKTRKL